MRFRVTNDHQDSLKAAGFTRSADNRGNRMHLPSCQECQRCTVKGQDELKPTSFYRSTVCSNFGVEHVHGSGLYLDTFWHRAAVKSSVKVRTFGRHLLWPSQLHLAGPDCGLLVRAFQSGGWNAPSWVKLVGLNYGQLTGGELSSLSWRSLMLFLTWRHLTLRGPLREEGSRRIRVQGTRMKEDGVPEVPPSRGGTKRTFRKEEIGKACLVVMTLTWGQGGSRRKKQINQTGYAKHPPKTQWWKFSDPNWICRPQASPGGNQVTLLTTAGRWGLYHFH